MPPNNLELHSIIPANMRRPYRFQHSSKQPLQLRLNASTADMAKPMAADGESDCVLIGSGYEAQCELPSYNLI